MFTIVQKIFIAVGILIVYQGMISLRAADTNEEGALPEPATDQETQGAKDGVHPEDEKSSDSSEKTPSSKDSLLLGAPLAPGMVKLLEQEIREGITQRQNEGHFDQFHKYAAGRLDASARRNTGSELNGNCRLRWYDQLLRDPLKAPSEAEAFTRELHRNALGEAKGLVAIIATASEKTDSGKVEASAVRRVETPEEALNSVKGAIQSVHSEYAAALATLTKSEIHELSSKLDPVMVGRNDVGHTLHDRWSGRRLCDLIEKLDRSHFFTAAEALAVLADPQLLKQLKLLPNQEDLKKTGTEGSLVAVIETPQGIILIGGKGRNVYSLDALKDVCGVIDLGGNDEYLDGTVGPERPVLVIIDLEGNDVYQSSKAGVQGGAILGISLLVDAAGDDRYQALDVAQGSVLAGVGILVDLAGSDRYFGRRRVQGQALGGIGLLLDHSGDDDYRAAMWAQGFAGPLGFALLDDLQGNDHYYCGGQYLDSYPETPGLEGWGQGVGAGLRQVANGGIGVILDGGGDDIYEFDYLSHGGGYWCGLGFARDFGGNDQRLITRKSFREAKRTQPSFQRFGCGWGCHYSLGFCFDDSGNDLYEGTIMGTGMAWDCSVGVLCDFGGDDEYKATGGFTQGTGAEMGLGVLFDYNGNDTYRGQGQGYASPRLSYHPLPHCGGNYAFCIDYGGKDQYGCGARNNSYTQRGAAGGFLIDRPRNDEVEQTATKQNEPAARGIAAPVSRRK